jgi:hypothetical protein
MRLPVMEKWRKLIAEHLDRDRGDRDRESYLMKEKQTVSILSGDSLIEATHGEGYVFDVFDDALVLRSLGEAQPHRIPWGQINEVSFSYAYVPDFVAPAPAEEKPPAPPFASRL